jgi:predicted MFS family arabinose efflux permease
MGTAAWILVAFGAGMLLGPFVFDQVAKMRKKND